MANTRELRRRIKSVKNTAQITKAMQMVAATKMRRAQNQAINGRPYSLNLNHALKRLLPLIKIESHPFLAGNSSKVVGAVLLSTDKSLCGALNTNLFRLIAASNLLSSDTVFYTVGKKGRNFVARAGRNLLADFENLDTVTFRQAAALSKLVMSSFLSGEVGEVYIVYPHFGSTLRQEPIKEKLLPIDFESVTLSIKNHSGSEETGGKIVNGSEFLFEPDPDTLLDFVLIHHLQIKIICSFQF